MRIRLLLCLFILMIAAASAHEAGEVIQAGSEGTHHIEAIVQTPDGHALPDMHVTAVLENQRSGQREEVSLHPMFSDMYRYGANVELADDTYLIHWHLDPPTFMRSAERRDRWTEAVEHTTELPAGLDVTDGRSLDTLTVDDMTVTFEVWPAKPMYRVENAHGNDTFDRRTLSAAFYWQTWAALIVGLLAGAMAMWALHRERRR